jgi:hypothetical protein
MERNQSFNLAYLAVLAPLCIVVSILYDYAYFKVFGLNISEIPSTINSHLKSSVDMLASVLILTLLMIVFSGFKTSQMNNSGDVTDNKSKGLLKFFKTNAVEIIILGLSLTIGFFYDSWHSVYFYLVSFFLFVNLCIDLSIPKLLEDMGKKNTVVFIVLIYGVMMLFGKAICDAIEIKYGKSVSSVSINECKQCNLMRVYDDYFIFWDVQEKNVKMISKEKIKTLVISGR